MQSRYPDALIQFEDFLTPNAYALLNRYRERVLCFNDDIQGTAAVALAGVYSSTRITGVPFTDLRIMFLGAGSAATGIADLMTAAFVDEGLSRRGGAAAALVRGHERPGGEGRTDLMEHNLPYAHDIKPLGFIEAIEAIRPHVLIGATGAPGTFTQAVIERMSAINERPVMFALSNPTSRAECTAEQAYAWSGGRAIFASGSPFAPVIVRGQDVPPRAGQQRLCLPRHRPWRGGLPCAHAARRVVPGRGADAGRPGATGRSRPGRALPAARATSGRSRWRSRPASPRKAYAMSLARQRRPRNVRRSVEAMMYRP